MYSVILLESASEFIQSLETKMKAKTLRTIELLKEFGPYLTMPHARKLTGHELHELRVKVATNIVRVFYFKKKNQVYILTSGFVKKDQKTDPKEIQRALRLKAQYLEESDDENS